MSPWVSIAGRGVAMVGNMTGLVYACSALRDPALSRFEGALVSALILVGNTLTGYMLGQAVVRDMERLEKER